MKKRKTVFIALGSIALVIALFIGSYIIRKNQFQATLPVSAMMGNEDINGATADNKTADYVVADEVENGSAISAEPSAKLDKVYEEAMANSNLEPYEIELIRSMVEKEKKIFEEALQSVRPGSKVIQEQPDTQTTNNNQKPQQPTTPTQPSGNTSISATVNNPDNRSDQQKQNDANDPFNPGTGSGPGGDTSHEPDFGLPDNRTNQQKYDDANDPFSGGYEGGDSDPIDHEPEL